MRTPVALSIAGSDSGAGAGIQADLKTFSAHGVYGVTVVTALTAQNTRGVQSVLLTPSDFVAAQMTAVLDDFDVGAIKLGMLGSAAIVARVAHVLETVRRLPIVLDPVLISTSGHKLLDDDAADILMRALLPMCALVTPNLPEAASLLGLAPATDEDEMRRHAQGLIQMGCQSVLLKGGHAAGATSVDLYCDGTRVIRLTKPRIITANSHGTGCTLSAAITAHLAQGLPMAEAVTRAKNYVWQALDNADRLVIKKPVVSGLDDAGHGPLHHFFAHKAWT